MTNADADQLEMEPPVVNVIPALLMVEILASRRARSQPRRSDVTVIDLFTLARVVGLPALSSEPRLLTP